MHIMYHLSSSMSDDINVVQPLDSSLTFAKQVADILTTHLNIDAVKDKLASVNIKSQFIDFFIRSDSEEHRFVYTHHEVAAFLGYSKGDCDSYVNFKKLILNVLVPEKDYLKVVKKLGSDKGGRSRITYTLSRIGCYKICMASAKPISNAVRQFFASCYEILKDYLHADEPWCVHKINQDRYIVCAKHSLEELESVGGDDKKERYYRDRLAAKVNGKTEVRCVHGFVDIVTDDSIIEVKHVHLWKQAFGQIEAYADAFPEKHKKIALIGTKMGISTDARRLLKSRGIRLIFISS
jgi:hypothetical protein